MTDTPADVRVRPFADVLREQRNGATHEELSEALHKLLASVAETGKKGTLQLTIAVEPLKGTNDGVVRMSDVVTLKQPRHDRKGSIFYIGHDGNAQRNDPNQLPFDGLRDVSAAESGHAGEPAVKEATR